MEETLSDIINREIDDEATAKEYIEFLDKKQKELDLQQEKFAIQQAYEHEKMMDSMPRAIRRKFLKEKAKFSNRFLKNVGITK